MNLVPHIRAPKLLLHGRYDEGAPLKSRPSRCKNSCASRNASSYMTADTLPRPRFTCLPSMPGWTNDGAGQVRQSTSP